MGGKSGGEKIVYPQPAPPPTAAQSAADYAAALPSIYNTQLQYQPLFNRLELDQYKQLAPEYAQLTEDVNKQLYPYTSGLQEQLAQIASERLSGGVPESMRNEYLSQLNAQLGTNVNAPIGADYVSRGLINQAEEYKNYYQNLGLSLAGRQPLAQAFVNPSSYNVGQNFGNYYQGNLQGYGIQQQAARPFTYNPGIPNWILGLQAGSDIAKSIGKAMAGAGGGASGAGSMG